MTTLSGLIARLEAEVRSVMWNYFTPVRWAYRKFAAMKAREAAR